MPVRLLIKPLWLIFRVLGQPNTMRTIFYTLPLFTSVFTSWLTGAFDFTTSSLIRSLSTAACSSGDILTGSSGFFASPNFPNNFPQYSRCIWNITVPSGYIIKLTFHHFELDRYPYSARVTITNVASDDNRQPFQLYGQSIPSPVYSVGNSIQVMFSAFNEQYSGFNASYTTITYESGEHTSNSNV